MGYTAEDKLQREVEKLTEEVRVLKRPLSQPSSWIGIIALLLSIGTNFWQLRSTKIQEDLSKIRVEQAELDEAKALKGKEIAQKATQEAEDRIAALRDDEQKLYEVREQYKNDIAEREKKLFDLTKQLAVAQESGNTEVLNKAVTQVRQDITTLQQSTQKTAQKISDSESEQSQKFRTAAAKEKEGFQNLLSGNYDGAIAAFQASEEIYPSYHNVYELARLIQANKSQMSNPAKKKEVFQKIVNDLSYGAPPDLLRQIKAIASQ